MNVLVSARSPLDRVELFLKGIVPQCDNLVAQFVTLPRQLTMG